ncbi:MAG: NAD(P)-dependent oxidoreductase [Casimicrobiaceae bacterium]
MERPAPIALLGLGLVGEALAGRLAEGGFALAGWDPMPARCAALGARGVDIATSAVTACHGARFVLLALPDTPALQATLAEITPVLAPGAIVLSFGTDDPDAIVAQAEALARQGIGLLDVPLSGSSAQIAAGEAVIMGGGAIQAWASATPLLTTIAAAAFHMGAAGAGSRAKLATNLLLGLNRAALAESLVFAESLGLDPASYIDLVRASPAYSRAVDAKAAKMLARDYAPQSRIRQHRKDIGLMLEAAHAAGRALPLTEAHARLLDRAIEAGDGELDNAAIIETIRRWPVAATPQ